MGPILNSVLLLSIFAALYAISGYWFFSTYHEKFWMGILVVGLMAVPIYYQINHLYSHFWLGTFCQIVWLSFCYGMGFLYVGLRKRSIRRLQDARDRASALLSDSLENTSKADRDFALYLRPFLVTEMLPTSLPGTHYTDSEFDGVLDFEGILEDSVRNTTPLVGLGRPAETYGAGRILTDDESWKAKVMELMQTAKTIFLIPSNRPGTLWEIQHIMQTGLLEKCIFIMPPVGAVNWTREPHEGWQYDASLVDQAGDWVVTADALKDIGLHLPEYEQAGAFFTMDRSGAQSGYAQLPLLLPTFSGATGYTREIEGLIVQLRDHAGVPPAETRKLDLLADEEVEVHVTPGGFEKIVHPHSPVAKLLWALGMALGICLLIWSCRNLRTTVLVTAESAVAYLFLWFVFRLFGQDAEA